MSDYADTIRRALPERRWYLPSDALDKGEIALAALVAENQRLRDAHQAILDLEFRSYIDAEAISRAALDGNTVSATAADPGYDYARILDLVQRVQDCGSAIGRSLADGVEGNTRARGLANQVEADAHELQELLRQRQEALLDARDRAEDE